MTLRDALEGATDALAAAGCMSPRLDAELLIADALGIGRERLFLDPEMEVPPPAARVIGEHVRRRNEREPVAYILGRKGFRNIELKVDRRVLVPRPESELLVEAALDLPEGARVHDVGTGSGAIALALKSERPDLEVVGTDASDDALAVARANAARLGLDVAFHHGDLLADAAGPLDAIVSNPPYVPAATDELPERGLARAWDAGRDGRALLDVAAAQLAARLETIARTSSFLRNRSLELSRATAAEDEDAEASVNGLRPRELAILRLYGEGLGTHEIAELLVLSVHTVRTHVRNALRGLGVGSRSAATRYAVEHELI